MFKEFIKDRDVLIISIVILFAIAFQVVSSEIEGYKEINAELLEDLKYEETKASAYLHAFEDQKNKNDNPLLPGPVLNITPCGGDIALYQNLDYVINYDFPTKPKKLSITFSHETVKQDSIINLMPLELNEKGNTNYGEVLTSYLAVGEQGILNAEIYAEDYDGSFTLTSCKYNTYLDNHEYEGDYKRDHIRSPYVGDGYANVTVEIEGKIWEQEWDSLEECAEDEWIIEWELESYNNYRKNESEKELTAVEFCSGSVTDMAEAYIWGSTFRYPVLTTENSANWSEMYDNSGDISYLSTCFDTINADIERYVSTSLDTFTKDIGYGYHWAYSLQGDFRTVGLSLHSSTNSTYVTTDSHTDFGYKDSRFKKYQNYIGNRNTPPEESFYLHEYGMVPDEGIKYVSFIFEVHTFTGGNHGMYNYTTLNYDLNTCKKITLKDIMSDEILFAQGYELQNGQDSLWMSLLSARLGDILSVDQGELPGTTEWTPVPWYKSAPNYSYSNLKAVSIHDEGLTFSFQPYVTGCWACGWPEITIGWANLWDIFTWGDWEVDDPTLYPNTVVQDVQLENIGELATKLSNSYELQDLIFSSTHFYHYQLGKGDQYFETSLEKQDGAISYGLSGNFTVKDVFVVKKFINVINSIIGFDNFSYSESISDADIQINLGTCLTKNAWNSILETDLCSSANGYFSSEDMIVWVDSDLYGLNRDRVLIHELGHSIGLNHSACQTTGLMSSHSNRDQSIISFSNFEIAQIKFLYSQIHSVGNIETFSKDLESGITYNEMTSYTDLEAKELDSTMNNQFCPDEKSTVYEEGESKDDNS
jgi:hypothetical protein